MFRTIEVLILVSINLWGIVYYSKTTDGFVSDVWQQAVFNKMDTNVDRYLNGDELVPYKQLWSNSISLCHGFRGYIFTPDDQLYRIRNLPEVRTLVKGVMYMSEILIDTLDTDGDNRINIQEFIAGTPSCT